MPNNISKTTAAYKKQIHLKSWLQWHLGYNDISHGYNFIFFPQIIFSYYVYYVYYALGRSSGKC